MSDALRIRERIPRTAFRQRLSRLFEIFRCLMPFPMGPSEKIRYDCKGIHEAGSPPWDQFGELVRVCRWCKQIYVGEK